MKPFFYRYSDSTGMIELPENYDFVKGNFKVYNFYLSKDEAMLHFYLERRALYLDDIKQLEKVLKLKEKKFTKLTDDYKYLEDIYPEEFL
jgi:hypothetical protein